MKESGQLYTDLTEMLNRAKQSNYQKLMRTANTHDQHMEEDEEDPWLA